MQSRRLLYLLVCASVFVSDEVCTELAPCHWPCDSGVVGYEDVSLSLLQTGAQQLIVESTRQPGIADSDPRSSEKTQPHSEPLGAKPVRLLPRPLEAALAVATRYAGALRTRTDKSGAVNQVVILLAVFIVGCCIAGGLAATSTDRPNRSRGRRQYSNMAANPAFEKSGQPQQFEQQPLQRGDYGQQQRNLNAAGPPNQGSAGRSPIVPVLRPGMQSPQPAPGQEQASRSPLFPQGAPASTAMSLPPAGPSSPIVQQLQVQSADVVMPPHLCPALVLPHCEAWFAVAYEKLAQGTGMFDLLGLSGKALLRATVETSALHISMTPTRSPPLASLKIDGTGVMRIVGASGKLYAAFGPGSQPGSFDLVGDGGGPPILTLVAGASQMNVLVPGSPSPIAWAARCNESDFFSGIEHLEVRVSPRVDAVLILCCVLAAIIFGGVKPQVTPRIANDVQ